MSGEARIRTSALVVIAAALVVWLMLAPGARGDALSFTVSNAPAMRFQSPRPVAPIAPGFVGVSMEYCAVTLYNTGATADPVLAHLIGSLASGQPVIRVGGDSTDLTHWDPSATALGGAAACPYSNFPLTTKTTVAIAALAHALRAKLILGINLKAHRTDWAYAEARALMEAIDPRRPYKYVKAFELGNEPDLYRRYESARGYAQFVQDFSRWTAVVRRAAKDPSVWTAGPSLGRVGFPWISGTHAGQLAAFVKAPSGPRLVTFHGYPFLASGVCPGDSCPSIHNLLLDGPSHGLAVGLAQYVARVPGGREVRDDEMGAVTNKGKPGVSNTFASALWALDTLFEKATAGFGGVNIHTIPGASYELFSHPQPRQWFVHPEYYGLLMFARAAPAGSHLLQVTPQLVANGGPSVKVWATHGADGKARIVIINKDIHAHNVVLRGPGFPVKGTPMIYRLQAKRTRPNQACPSAYAKAGLCATAGVTLGGRAFGAQAGASPGGDMTSSGLLAAPVSTPVRACKLVSAAHPCLFFGSVITIPMPAGSATLLTDG